jgi:hypothetical protein
MMILCSALSVLVIVGVLFEAFEVVVLPRRVTRPYRFTRLYYRSFWKLWRAVALSAMGRRRVREAFLSWFGPLSLLGLFVCWFLGLVLGFGLLMWSLDLPVQVTVEGKPDLPTYWYLSGVTFFTLGFGDVTPREPIGRMLLVIEAGLGFGFLALAVSYLPVLYQAFSRREVTISMLDARAGSPPSAAQMLIRAAEGGGCDALDPFLREWERWAAEVLESHLSYPVLSYYRSQHDNQSWLAALTAVLDTCALLLTGLKEQKPFQAQLTFAMARHAVVDLALVFQVPPLAPVPDRLPADKLQSLREKLRKVGLDLRAEPAVDAKLAELRGMYEPFVNAMAWHFVMDLPAIDPDVVAVDNWQTSAWTRRTPGIGKLPIQDPSDQHFD